MKHLLFFLVKKPKRICVSCNYVDQLEKPWLVALMCIDDDMI